MTIREKFADSRFLVSKYKDTNMAFSFQSGYLVNITIIKIEITNDYNKNRAETRP